MGAAASTVSPKPYQPSPKRAAPRSAGAAWPPMTIGGCGRWRGLGSKRMPSKAAWRPWKRGSSSVQRTRIASRYSSVMAPRSGNETPSARNSAST